MPGDRQHSQRSRSRSPRRRSEHDVDHRHHSSKHDSARPSRSARSPSRSRPRSLERLSRSPERRRHQRRDSRSPSHLRSRSRSRDRKRKRRSKSRSRSPDRKEKRRRDRSVSSPSDSEDDSHRRNRKDKRKEDKRSHSKERRKEKKREKKERKEKKKKEKGNVPHWGKYGIISDVERVIFTKSQEFHTWLVEERKINPETTTKEQQKKEFARFVEDYNTATLPHEKYYNMEAYERRMSALRQGEYLPPADDSYDFRADMKAVSSAHKKKSVEQESYMTKEQLMELRKVQQERSEVGRMKLLGMDIKQNFGVRMDGATFDG